MLNASGKRVVLVGPDGKQLRKLRKGSSQIKVYNDELKPLGYVRWRLERSVSAAKSNQKNAAHTAAKSDTENADDTPVADSDGSQPKKPSTRVEIKSLGSPESLTILAAQASSDSTHIVEVSEHFRIVRQPPVGEPDAQYTWTVFGPDKNMVGVFEKLENSEWRLSTGAKRKSDAMGAREFRANFRVQNDASGGRMQVIRGGKIVATVKFGELAPVELLALQLDDLPLLERISVGVWLAHNVP